MASSLLAEVVWGWANGDTIRWPQGSAPTGITFSESMLTNGQYYLVSTATFDYTPILGKLMSNLSERFTGDKDNFLTIPLSDGFILRPRGGSCVEFENNCATYSPD